MHITRVPEVRAAVLDRTLNRATCSGCGLRIAIDTAFAYVDVERGHWLQIEPVRRRAEWAAVEQYAMQALRRGLDLTSPIISGLAESARRRVVFGTEELREKLIVWDAGIDDGLLECIKLRAAIDDPSLVRARLIADRVTEDGGLELVCVDDTPPRRYAVPASWVDRALDEQPSLQARFPQLFRGGFVNALRLAAVALLLAVGCAQPTARETPPTHAKEATRGGSAGAVADAATGETTPLVNMEPPADAGPRKVAWESLRNRDSSGAAVRVAVMVAQVQSEGRESVVVFDRGRDDGVRDTWQGGLLDADNRRVFDVFVVTKVDRHSCQARVKANPDQLARSNRAVLWDPAGGGDP